MYVISSIFLFKFLGYRFEAFFIKDEGGTTVETGIVGRDDGRPVILPRVAYDLIDIWQGIRDGQLVAVAPDDTPREIHTPAQETYLTKRLNTLIEKEQTVQMDGIRLTDYFEVALEPGLVHTGMGEEILL